MRRMTQEILEHKTIDQIRNQKLDKEVVERIAAARQKMERKNQSAKARLPGNFISFKSDKETKTLFFTGKCDEFDKPATDWSTKQEIPGRTTHRWRWQVYDISNTNAPSDISIWERGYKESEQIMYYLSQNQQELVVMRNGRPNSTDTTYSIYPANR